MQSRGSFTGGTCQQLNPVLGRYHELHDKPSTRELAASTHCKPVEESGLYMDLVRDIEPGRDSSPRLAIQDSPACTRRWYSDYHSMGMPSKIKIDNISNVKFWDLLAEKHFSCIDSTSSQSLPGQCFRVLGSGATQLAAGQCNRVCQCPEIQHAMFDIWLVMRDVCPDILCRVSAILHATRLANPDVRDMGYYRRAICRHHYLPHVWPGGVRPVISSSSKYLRLGDVLDIWFNDGSAVCTGRWVWN